jgi:hypothetical protein
MTSDQRLHHRRDVSSHARDLAALVNRRRQALGHAAAGRDLVGKPAIALRHLIGEGARTPPMCPTVSDQSNTSNENRKMELASSITAHKEVVQVRAHRVQVASRPPPAALEERTPPLIARPAAWVSRSL